MSFSRVLIANRGEIAIRVINVCRALGIESVVTVAEADRESLAARMADRAICIGPSPAIDSYLKPETILTAALGTGCDAIHPGYGFLAEDPELVDLCAAHHVEFIGPRSESIRIMGDKLRSREFVRSCGIPVIPGSDKAETSAEAAAFAEKIGLPVILKASAGGGGRGIKIVLDTNSVKEAFETAAAEAREAFGNPTLYVERYYANARHVEVQVLGDSSGKVIHLGERDCSLQRRYQKVIEEAPALSISEELRNRILEAAVIIAKKCGYENAGTVEFVVDQDTANFYFLEMNTRIQVEHPVTEMITGVDLVQEQIHIAGGQALEFDQPDIRFEGHAIECRINAESPLNSFYPTPGLITDWRPPEGSGIRIDSHCYAGYSMPIYYDSLLAKLIVHNTNRLQAIERMQQALENFHISGPDTGIPFLQFLINEPEFLSGDVNTLWLEGKLEKFLSSLTTSTNSTEKKRKHDRNTFC